MEVFHPRHRCPARNATCYKYQKKGHFYSVCRANKSAAAIVETPSPTLATAGLLDISEGLKKACTKIRLNRNDVLAFIDFESTNNLIHFRVVKMCSLKSTDCCKTIMMDTKSLEAQLSGFCVTTIIVNKETYPRIKLHIFPNLCADAILLNSTIDLKSVYHQVPLHGEDKKFTAFEANGCLYQFRRMLFGVTNGL